ncbi:unnamed protein product [Ilex paraguariensis]|uniref:CHCH domain-containing protein n=1 Tax=Ilex paraguariensis TaxID=185542 RepID=A0ABC8RHI8_9AQUA
MDSDKTPQPVCAQEALNLLNCVTETPYDQDKCLRLLQSLRDCVLNKGAERRSYCHDSGYENVWALKVHFDVEDGLYIQLSKVSPPPKLIGWSYQLSTPWPIGPCLPPREVQKVKKFSLAQDDQGEADLSNKKS